MSTIEFRSLGKQFGSHPVLRDINLRIEEGEFVVLVGPSGCGKTTLLRILAGLEQASQGKVLIDGRDMTDALPGQRRLAMVFQSYALYPHMTVRQNLSFGMRMRGVARPFIEAQIEKAGAILKIEDLMDRRPGELSGGQCQRVAIGRAIVQQPGAFLFDEPLSNLDTELRLHLRLELIQLHRVLGATMVCVTHDQVEAMTMADRIVVLRDGVIEQVGAPRTIYDRPRNRFVAQFMGSPPMNILPLRDVPLTKGLPTPDGATHWGARPEHLQPQDDGPLALQLQHIERVGASDWLHGTVLGTPHRLCMQTTSDRPVVLGQSIRVQPVADRLHWFNDHGDRLGSDIKYPPLSTPPS